MQRGKAICPKSFNQQWNEGLDPSSLGQNLHSQPPGYNISLPAVWGVDRKANNILHHTVYLFLDALETPQDCSCINMPLVQSI